ncbi:hypothetical protein BBM24_10325 [Vibrio parahaemolyticus]|uniref:hypothetical protein n=1 Tax=Vibrio parahaemolyticus TaxID=670 RepID=UPI00084B7C89|nr:hypothetical protein [Vibrio parahaemolyticus]EGR0527083.1 hypothetical protein [Vibrio parahaemolyticus]EGR0560078.1 hypothetical protein [Vibrio parahaemolyticus]EGR0748380.1 hypothetical protein [Vibrio parahaemolyticus]EGR1180619.1 hypothetical protein [Vibrio parahaemolyticus]EHK0725711.1 hypothetical protein [Vibrio parahaemolyticus]
MATAIQIVEGGTFVMKDCVIRGFDVGIDAHNVGNMNLNTVAMNDCNVGVRGRGIQNLSAVNCTHGSGAATNYEAIKNTSYGHFTGYMKYAFVYLKIHDYNPYY